MADWANISGISSIASISGKVIDDIAAFDGATKPSGSPTYVVDTYGTSIEHAYGLVKMRSTQTNCIRIRRASDNSEQDIGFTGNYALDTASIATFCSGTTGYIKTFYDQSGNGLDATQTSTSAQAVIYQSGAVITDSAGNYACLPDGTHYYATSSSGMASHSGAHAVFGFWDTNDVPNGVGSRYTLSIGNPSTGTAGSTLRIDNKWATTPQIFARNVTYDRRFSRNTSNQNKTFAHSLLYSGTTSSTGSYSVNSTAFSVSSTNNGTISYASGSIITLMMDWDQDGSSGAEDPWLGCIIYSADKSSDRSNIDGWWTTHAGLSVDTLV